MDRIEPFVPKDDENIVLKDGDKVIVSRKDGKCYLADGVTAEQAVDALMRFIVEERQRAHAVQSAFNLYSDLVDAAHHKRELKKAG